MKSIIATNEPNLHILVDEGDYELLNKIGWNITRTRTSKGVKFTVNTGINKELKELLGDRIKTSSTLVMARLIMDAKSNERVKYHKGNGLDMRRKNLYTIKIKQKPNYKEVVDEMEKEDVLKTECKDCGRDIDQETYIRTHGKCDTCHNVGNKAIGIEKKFINGEWNPETPEKEYEGIKTIVKPVGTASGTMHIEKGLDDVKKNKELVKEPSITLKATSNVGKTAKNVQDMLDEINSTMADPEPKNPLKEIDNMIETSKYHLQILERETLELVGRIGGLEDLKEILNQ